MEIRNTSRYIVFIGLFLIPFVPFLVSSALFFPFITTKAFAWRIIVEVVFAAWVLLALLDQTYRPKKSPILYAVLAFLAVIGLANLFGVAPADSFWSNFERMEGYITLLHLGAFFLVTSAVFKERDWTRWWNTTLGASFVMVLYSFAQLAGAITINQGGVRVDGTLGNATYLAVYMLLHIFLAALMLWREWKNVTKRWLYGILIVAQIIVLYYTATRGAILGLLGGLFITALLNIRNKEAKTVRRLSLGIILGLVVVVGGFFFLRNSAFVKGSPVLTRFASISTKELKSGGRSFVWPIALEGFKEKPILGWGQENFIYVFQKHYKPEMYQLEPWFDRAHNIFLDWMVVGGLLGIVSYLSLYVAFLYLLWRRSSSFSHVEKSILTGLLAGYFFHNFFVFDHLISYTLFFSLLAYVHSNNGGNYLWERNLSEAKTVRIGFPLVLIILLLPLYFANFKPLAANLYLIEGLKSVQLKEFEKAGQNFNKSYQASSLGRKEVAQHLATNSLTILDSDLSLEKKNEFYAFAKGVVVGEAEHAPDDVRQRLLTGSFLTSTGYPDEALVHLERARTLSPNKQQVYFDLGSAYFNKNDTVSGLGAFKYAYDLAPEYLEAKVVYLIGAIYANDRVLEKALLSELGEQAILNDRILTAYYTQGRFVEVISILEARKKLDPANALTYDQLIQQVRSQ